MRSDKSKEKSKKALTREKISGFLERQGFYIVLFVCVAIIGVTAYMTSGKGKNPLKDITENRKKIERSKDLTDKDMVDPLKEPREGKVDIKVRDSVREPDKGGAEDTKDKDGKDNAIKTEGEKDKDPKVTGDAKDDGKGRDTKGKDDEAKETLASNSKTKDGTKKESAGKKGSGAQNATGGGKAVYPVQGKVLKPHSMDELVYSSTLKEWTTHPGLDIEAFVGAEVKAAMAGTVEEIVEDSLMGITVTIDHGNGLKTYYANLSTGNMVTIGQKVDKGQIISGVGRTASSEILDNPHLHFEVIKDGKSVDPTGYLN